MSSKKIEQVLRDVSARRLRTHKVAKRELLALADNRTFFRFVCRAYAWQKFVQHQSILFCLVLRSHGFFSLYS